MMLDSILGLFMTMVFANQTLKQDRNNHNTDDSQTNLWASAYFGKYFRNAEMQMHLNL